MCALRLYKLLTTVKILLSLTRDFLHVLCHVQGSVFREVNKRNGFRYIRDISIEFTERFFSSYARSRIKL